MGQVEQRVFLFQRVQRAFHAAQQGVGGGEQAWVGGQAVLDEGQRLAAEDLLDQRRLDIKHAVMEAILGAGFAVVDFIRMQDHGPARQVVAPAAAVLEALHPRQRATDGVGVVAVQVVAMTGEKRLDTLQPPGGRRAVDPVFTGAGLPMELSSTQRQARTVTQARATVFSASSARVRFLGLFAKGAELDRRLDVEQRNVLVLQAFEQPG